MNTITYATPSLGVSVPKFDLRCQKAHSPILSTIFRQSVCCLLFVSTAFSQTFGYRASLVFCFRFCCSWFRCSRVAEPRVASKLYPFSQKTWILSTLIPTIHHHHHQIQTIASRNTTTRFSATQSHRQREDLRPNSLSQINNILLPPLKQRDHRLPYDQRSVR